MGLKFTKAQQHAIDFEGKDTLISAAAGSGKTAVLSERVLRKLKEGTSLDALVLLTFTNKAAAEMKERIRQKIMDEPSLSHELEKIDSAHIKTFDSYALYLLKRYGHVKNIPKTIGILDQTDAMLIKEDLIENMFLEYLNKGNKPFIALLDRYTDKSDYMLKKNILGFYESLSYFKDKQAFEQTMRQHYFKEAHFEKLFTDYEQDVINTVKRFLKAINRLAQKPFTHEKIIDYIAKMQATFAPLKSMNSYEAIQEFFSQDPRFPRLPGNKNDNLLDEEKTIIKSYKEKILDKLLKNLKGESKKNGDAEVSKVDHKAAYMSLKDHVQTIMDILEDFEARYLAKQHEIERFDYTGVARTVLAIIEEHSDIRDELSEALNEIMVDEYQDTNALQEAFLSLLKRDNLYMVGDIKQSIYRFRNAEPSIFANKYVHFKKTGEGEAIDLNLNFRSRKEVLDDINTLFEHVMDSAVGGIDYDANQALKFGNESYLDAVSETTPYGINLHVYDQARFDDTFNSTFTKKEAELMHVAKTIKRYVETGEYMTKSGDGLRPIEYGDCAILIDRGTSFDDARRIFEYVGVPLLVHKNVSFTDYPEIMMVKQLLTLIVSLSDKQRYKQDFHRAFMSVMRSFVSEDNDDAIVAQVLDFPKEFTDKETFMKTIHPQFQSFIDKAFTLAHSARHSRLDHIVYDIIHSFDVYEHLVKISGSEDGVTRLDYLLELAHTKMIEGITLEGFIDYFKAVTEKDLGIELSLRSDFSPNKVNLMTMHKSKGLEFPFVFIVHLNNTFNNPIDSNMMISERYGVLLPHEDEGDDKHFLYSLFRNEEKTDDIAERLRVLYVALSRAEEGLHIVYCDDEKAPEYKPDGLVDINIRRQYRSFHDIFKSVLPFYQSHKTTVDIARYYEDITYQSVIKEKGLPTGDLLQKTYAPKPPQPKLSVETSFSSSITEFLDEHSLDAIDKGNLFHDTLEQLDFFQPIDAQLKAFDLTQKDQATLKTFFNTDLIQSLDMTQVYKEYPFMAQSDVGQTSGFIDLLIETSDSFIIIDYKLKDIEKPHYIDQVNGYKKTLTRITDKRVEGYLYSILEGTFKKVS